MEPNYPAGLQKQEEQIEAHNKNLNQQIEEARNKTYTDQYTMSLGELTHLYNDNGLTLNNYTDTLSVEQKTQLIENLLLKAADLHLTVEQKDNGQWEVVDGAHTLYTVLELQGLMPNKKHLTLGQGDKLTHLDGMVWSREVDQKSDKVLDWKLRILIKRYQGKVSIIAKY